MNITPVIRTIVLTLGALTLLGAIAGAAKKRHIVRRFEGKTPSEARAAVLEYATRRTGDPERAAHIADRVVERLQQRGVLAPDADETAA